MQSIKRGYLSWRAYLAVERRFYCSGKALKEKYIRLKQVLKYKYIGVLNQYNYLQHLFIQITFDYTVSSCVSFSLCQKIETAN